MTPIEKAHLVNQERRAAGIPRVTLDPIAKAARNPRSLRLAIDAKCWDCIGAGADPHPRGAIRECAVRECSLWPVRPYRGGDAPAA